MMARTIRPGPCRRPPVRTSCGGLSRIEVKFGSSAGCGLEAREVWEKKRGRSRGCDVVAVAVLLLRRIEDGEGLVAVRPLWLLL